MSESHENTVISPDLSLMQRWFAAVITHPMGVAQGVASPEAQQVAPLTREELEAMVTRSKNCTAHDRLSIYAHAYFARLVDCLGETFPMVRRLLGTEVFNGFAFEYLQQHPSTSYTLGELGREFVPFVRSTRRGESITNESPDWTDLLIDLAQLEWTIDEVFDGPGVERIAPLSAESVVNLSAEQWAQARLQLAPCVRLLASAFPVNTFYSALRSADEASLPPMPTEEPQWILITRRDYIVRRVELSPSQHALLTALQAGQPIGQAIEKAAEFSGEADESFASQMQQWFAQWMRMGLFVAIDVGDSLTPLAEANG